eukprot:1147849-Pelagomonas_calceolata.AAC.2
MARLGMGSINSPTHTQEDCWRVISAPGSCLHGSLCCCCEACSALTQGSPAHSVAEFGAWVWPG